jgi:ABC-type branched-subunit amino acid transport system substrate-binding protein
LSNQRRHFVSNVRACVACLAALAWLASVDAHARRAPVPAPARDSLTAQEKRGKQIYTQGASPSSKEILAYIGDASMEVPGSVMACANCHGLDGRGKPEGGVTPSDITWGALTKPYAVAGQGGRTHPPYTERAVELALTRGLDPAGNKLLNVMPRYQMSGEDMADLVAYLKRVGSDLDPGVTDDTITVGTVIPSRADLAGLGQAIRAATAAYFEEVNSRGGIYSRKLGLKFVETGDTPQATSDNVRRFVQDEQVFALTGAFIAGADRELAALFDQMGTPLVGPLTLYPQVGRPLNRRVFYILPGMEEQARALASFACRQSAGKKSGAAIVSPDDEMSAGVAEAITSQTRKGGCDAPQTYSYKRGRFDAAAAAAELSRAGRGSVFFLGAGEEALAFMKEAERLGWSPQVYLPGAGAGGLFEAPRGFSRKIFISFPTSPADQTAEGVEEFRALSTKYSLPKQHVAAQLSAFAAAKVLVEGLKRAGRDVSREKLIETLEGLNEYGTGVTPAITYGPNRRVGASGAYVVTVDIEKKEFVPASPWVSAD